MSSDKNYSHGPVPISARKGGLALTFVMLDLTFFSTSMWTGGTLGTGLSFYDFFLAVLIGNLILGIYTAFLGYIGSKTGLKLTFSRVTPSVFEAHGSLHFYLVVYKLVGLGLVLLCLPSPLAKQLD